MDFTFLVVIFIVLFGVAALTKKAPNRNLPYERNQFLLSKAEQNFYGALLLALGGDYAVMCKVRIADVLNTRKGLSSKERTAAFNQIARKPFDFVLCNSQDLSIVAAIELDDASHRASNRRARDNFVEGACDAAGLKLHRFKRAYSVEEVRQAILGAPVGG